MNSRRLWGLSQAGLGAVALVTPGPVAKTCAGKEPAVPSWLVRVLGGRLVLQGCFLLVRPTDEVVALGGAVDALHGSSMVLAAIVKPDYRRSALIAGALAAASVAVSVSLNK